jgi:mannose-1-phosphate guanylyltransferase
MNANNPRPLYEARSWGEYTVLHHRNTEDGEALTKHLVILPSCNISYQYHLHRREIWTVIQGNGILLLNGEQIEIFTGSIIDIPCEAKHSIRAETELHIIEVQLGSPLIEEDIVRLAVEWEEIKSIL